MFPSTTALAPALVVDNLRKNYGNGVEALKGIALTLRLGDCLALLGFILRRIDDRILEAEMPRSHDLNALFVGLSSYGIVVTSMRKKANRLKDLFVHRVERGRPEPGRRMTHGVVA